MPVIRREKVHALVLSRRNSGEADRLVTLFTRDYGLLRVMAKGVRKIASRRGPHLEPYTHVVAVLSGADGRYFLSNVETVERYTGLHATDGVSQRAQLLARVVYGLFDGEEAHPRLFDAVCEAWQQLPHVTVAKQAMVEVSVLFVALRAAGIQPEVRQCQGCGTVQPTEAVVLEHTSGGWRCLSCHHSFAQTHLSLPPRLLKVTKFLARHPERALQLAITEEEGEQVSLALRAYVDGVLRDLTGGHSRFSAALPAFAS